MKATLLNSRRSLSLLSPKSWMLIGLTTALLASLTGCALVGQIQRTATTTPPVVSAFPPAPASTTPPLPTASGLPPIAEVAAAVRPAVVSINTQDLGVDFFLQPVQKEGAGSGVIFDSSGHILTNNHVVENARNIQVTLPDGRSFDKVTVVGKDPTTDLAILQVQGTNLPMAKLGDSDKLRVGEWVIAIGNALALEGGPTVTAGVIGALGRSIQESGGAVLYELIQTDAAINPGNSGGPLINLNGEVVGINTAIDTRGQGIGFAISLNSARPIIDQLVRTGRVVRAFLGVRIATLTPNIAAQLRISTTEGVVIASVTRGTPAAQAGLQANDVITKLDGASVKTTRDLQSVIQKKKPGDKLQVTVKRNGQEQTVTATLGEQPSGQ